MGGVQQRFGRNTPPVEAHSAQPWVAFDKDNFFAQVGRVKSRGISTRPGANDNNFSLNRIHDQSLTTRTT
jgi:hypothetical protein